MSSRTTSTHRSIARIAATVATLAVAAVVQTSIARADDAVAAPATGATASAPATTGVSPAELESLRARIAQLEAAQNRVDGAIQQSQAIDAAIRDADSRQYLDAGTLTSGWENGFKIRSADGAYEMQPYIESQFRYTSNDTGDYAGGTDDNFQGGFEVRRFKLGLKGHAFNQDFRYNFRLSFDRSTGADTIDYAYGEYQFAQQWAVRFGQFKLNWTHEEFTSDTRQLVAERSLMNALLGGGNTNYVQGVGFIYGDKANPLHGEFTFTDGDNSANTNYTDQFGSTTSNYQDFGVAARGEYKVFGNWDDYTDFTARKDQKDLLVLGGGVDWAQGGDGNVYRLTADAQYENTAGLSAYASGIYTIADGDVTAPFQDQAWGALAQVGYLIPGLNDWEVFGRYDLTHIDETSFGGHHAFHEISAGVNKYFVGHNAKFTVDLNYLPNGSYTGAGGLGVTNTEERQVILRTQFQLLL